MTDKVIMHGNKIMKHAVKYTVRVYICDSGFWTSINSANTLLLGYLSVFPPHSQVYI